MERFAFLLHPLEVKDFTRKFKLAGHLPESWVESFFSRIPPFRVSHITGVRSATGVEAEGWFIGLPMTAGVLLRSPWETVLGRLLQAGRLAEKLGAGIFGLGAFTKVVGDRGVSVARGLSIPVTTGNSLTTWTAVRGSLEAARQMGIEPSRAAVSIIGATGAIGRACALLLAGEVGELILVGRDREKLATVADAVGGSARGEVRRSTDPRAAARESMVVITVSSAPGVLVEAEDLQPGAVVCDVARPRNVSAAVGSLRDDCLVIDGGVIRVPGQVEFGFDFGFPPGTAEACIAETMTLALEGRYESYTLGGEIAPERVEEIGRLSEKHGFSLDGFRRFERAIPAEKVLDIRNRAGARRAETT